MIRAIHELLSRLVSMFRRRKLDEDFEAELSAHIEMLTQENRNRGLSPDEARRQAFLRMGSLNSTKQLHHEARGLPRIENVFQASWLDFKLGVRMLRKSPGMTIVGVMGMGVAIAAGAGAFAFSQATIFPTIPLEQGDRLVGIENWDTRRNNQEYRSLHDFVTWRAELKSIEDVAAFRPIERNLITEDGPAGRARVSEITAAGLQTARVAPLLGRLLTEDDERQGAPDVVVIGYDIWERHFASDANVLGRTLRLGEVRHTVVGVMPKGFAFPISDNLWTPLRTHPADFVRGSGPQIFVFGRLAPGFTMESAQAELTRMGMRAAEAFAETNGHLRPRVVSYAAITFDNIEEFVAIQFLAMLLLLLIYANIALLIYARTAARQGEIAVRNALGASRRRIVAQLFCEALVLASLAAVIGVMTSKFFLQQIHQQMEGDETGGIPFWISYDISSETIAVTAALTLLAGLIAGVLPALKATGRNVELQLRQLSGGTGMQLGRTWTTLIVAQVAVAVALLPPAVYTAWDATKYGISEPGFPSHEFLTASLEMDQTTPPSATDAAYRRDYLFRYKTLQKELMTRLKTEPGVSAVTRASGLPGEESGAKIEVEGSSAGSGAGHQVRYLWVDVNFFEAFGFSTLTGQLFESADMDAASERVVVNRAFVQQILGGGNALGRRVRYVNEGQVASDAGGADSSRWYEIVGVVGNLPAQSIKPGEMDAKLYHPLEAGAIYPELAVRLRGVTPARFAARLQEVIMEVSPTLVVRRIMALDEVHRQQQAGMHLLAGSFALVTLSVLLLSAAGIYSLMSLTVARRQRDIAIRTALGADRRHILGCIFARSALQLLIGVVTGIIAALGLDYLADGELMGGEAHIILPLVAALTMTAGLLAAIGPARRGLRISPAEALKEE